MLTLKDELNIDINQTNISSDDFAKISDGFKEAQAVLISLGYTEKEIDLGLGNAKSLVKNINDTQEILQKALAKNATKNYNGMLSKCSKLFGNTRAICRHCILQYYWNQQR